jgi:hypothetical protein
MESFAQACADAGFAPEDVIQRAGVHRSTWFRWKDGGVSPTLRKWDAVQQELERLKRSRAA